MYTHVNMIYFSSVESGNTLGNVNLNTCSGSLGYKNLKMSSSDQGAGMTTRLNIQSKVDS